MTDTVRQAILGLCQQAMMADGAASEAEQRAIGRIAEKLQAVPGEPPGAASSQAVARLAEALRGTGLESEALEMAWAICAADGPPNGSERWFLEALRGALGVSESASEAIRAQAESLTTAPAAPPVIPGPGGGGAPPAGGPAGAAASAARPDLADLVKNTAIMAGALEILPHSLATLGILPLQMRMVYRIGKAYGYELDSGHIRDFLATAGVGLAAQMAESFAERAARGLFRGLVGGLGGMVAGQAAASGVAFASTYALGELARQYYEGGRRFSAVELRSAYENLITQGRAMQAGFGPGIREQASRLDPSKLSSFVHGFH